LFAGSDGLSMFVDEPLQQFGQRLVLAAASISQFQHQLTS
jgi:hypothetical protein